MMKFLLFTKTNWHEPPRLRHQIAELLADRGHEVVFFEKCTLKTTRNKREIRERITLVSHPHLAHNQLKFIAPLRWLDEIFVKREIRKALRIQPNDIVINFNFDYHFLRDIFPAHTLIHIVNDDFPAATNSLNRKTAEALQAHTASRSNHTLCVSYFLTEKIRHATPHCSVFLPWARHKYLAPEITCERNEILYWGYINDRIDFESVVEVLDKGVTINFFGHITSSPRVDRLLAHDNCEYHGISRLEDAPDVLARCCCSILPYDSADKGMRCLTMGNRAFELLSFGLPLLHTDLPYLIEAPHNVIYRCNGGEEFMTNYAKARDSIYSSQADILSFLDDHNPTTRYDQLISYIATGQE